MTRPLTPLKWQKYLLLAHMGLTDRMRLDAEIVRFPRHDVRKLLQSLERRLSAAAARGQELLFVIKLVDPEEVGRLANIRVTSRPDLAAAKRALEAPLDKRISELWLCPTSIDSAVLSTAGRLLVGDDFADGHTLEQVWRCSPRLLEEVRSSNPWGFAWPYLRASRRTWGFRYWIEALYRPREWPDTAASLADDAVTCMRLLEARRESAEFFIESLSRLGITTVSLEYKIVAGDCWFIDWDTPHDRRVLSAFQAQLSVLS